MEASAGRRTGVFPLHRSPRDDVSTCDGIGGDSRNSPKRGRRDAGQLSDVTGSSATAEVVRSRLNFDLAYFTRFDLCLCSFDLYTIAAAFVKSSGFLLAETKNYTGAAGEWG